MSEGLRLSCRSGQPWVASSRCQRSLSLDSKEIKPVNPEGNQPWIFTGRTDAEAEALILWPPNWKRP